MISNTETKNRRERWLFGHYDRPGAIRVVGDPMKMLRKYEQTHWRMSELVALYGVPKHKLAELLPPPDLVLTCCRQMRLWERDRVLAALGQPS